MAEGTWRAENIVELVEQAKKVSAWLDKIALNAEIQAKRTRFITLREALEFDVKNYRATNKGLKTILAKLQEGK